MGAQLCVEMVWPAGRDMVRARRVGFMEYEVGFSDYYWEGQGLQGLL